MIKYLLVALLTLTLFTNCENNENGCLDKDEPGFSDIDGDGNGDDCDVRDDRNPLDRIQLYLDERGWTAESTESGLHYIIDEPGTGDEYPTTSSTIQIHFHGTLENGNVFDTTQGRDKAQFNLGSQDLILGWREGIPLFKKGGKGKLIIPPNLAYGDFGNPPAIQPNAVLIFEIELLSFTN